MGSWPPMWRRPPNCIGNATWQISENAGFTRPAPGARAASCLRARKNARSRSEGERDLAPLAQRALGLDAHDHAPAGLLTGYQRPPLAKGHDDLRELRLQLEQLPRAAQADRLGRSAAPLHLQLERGLTRAVQRAGPPGADGALAADHLGHVV